jgi:hypothetical protein
MTRGYVDFDDVFGMQQARWYLFGVVVVEYHI